MPHLNTLLYLAIMLFAGLAFGRLAKLCKMPNVTGYLVAGLILGPSLLKVFPADTIEGFNIISEMALAFIAFSVGGNFKISYLKRIGIAPILIAIFEAFGGMFFVTGALLAFGTDPSFAILLGAIASATAPAATLMVIKQYNAKGPVTDTLICVVALDDAVALIAFGFAVAISKGLTNPGASIAMSILNPFIELVESLAIGAALGALFAIPLRWFKKDGNRLALTIGFVFVTSGICTLLGVSELLACMALGMVLVNITKASDSVLKLADSITPPLFMLFFVVSGADLKLSVVPTVGLVGIIYILARVAGKIFGSWLGAKVSKAPKPVQKYLGPMLIPQAGVAIGLSLLAGTLVPDYAQQIRAVVLCATLIYEICGPIIVKIFLNKSGEITLPKKAKREKTVASKQQTAIAEASVPAAVAPKEIPGVKQEGKIDAAPSDNSSESSGSDK